MNEQKKTYTYTCKICGQTMTGDRFICARHMKLKHPGAKVKVETKVKPPETTTPEQIAEALLRKVINWATEKETYTERLSHLKEVQSENAQLKEELRRCREEKERLLKIHNEQAQGRIRFTTTEELRRLAGSQS